MFAYYASGLISANNISTARLFSGRRGRRAAPASRRGPAAPPGAPSLPGQAWQRAGEAVGARVSLFERYPDLERQVRGGT